MTRSRRVRLVVMAAGLVTAAVGVAGATGTAHAAVGAPPASASSTGGERRGVMPVFGSGGAAAGGRSVAASTSAPAHLQYYGGKVVSAIRVLEVLYGVPGASIANPPGGSISYEKEVQGTVSPNIATFYGGITNSTYLDLLSEYDTTGNPQNVAGTNQTIARGSYVSQIAITPSPANDPFSAANEVKGKPTIDDSNIQAELEEQITAGHLPAPTLDSGNNLLTLYALYFPHLVTVTMGGASSGQDFCAYHSTTSSPEAYYSVLPDFSTGGMSTGCGHESEFQNLTSVSSHELAEVITDPEVGLSGSSLGPPLAWYDADNNPGSGQQWGEIGDICNGEHATTTGADGVVYTVQKLWSNHQDACVADPGSAPPPPPPPFHPQGVGAPQVAVTPDGSTQLVFWKSPNNQLAEAWYTGNWNGPITFAQLGTMTSTPSVAVTKDGSTQLVFWEGPGGHLLEAWYTGEWNGPVDWTAAWGGRGLLASAPSVVPTTDGEQLVFWRGTDGHLWEAWYTGAWNGPADFSSLGTLASSPSATITPDGSQQLVFWQGTDNRLTEVWFSGTWHGPVEWTSLGVISSPPSVVVSTDGSTQLVFYKSPSGDLVESWYAGSWNGPLDLTASKFSGVGSLTSSPSAAVTPDGSTQLVFWQGPGATLWEGWYAGGAWHGPVDFSAA